MKFLKKVFWFIAFLIAVYFLFTWMQQKKDVKITQTTKSVVEQLQHIRKLETAEMTITKIMEWEEPLSDLVPRIGLDNVINDFLFKNKVVFEIEWKVVAGFDMAKLNYGSITVNSENEVKIILPEAEILYVELTEWTKPFDRELGLLTKWDINMETKIRNQAKEMLRDDALQAGILEHAKQSVQKTLTDLLIPTGVIVSEIVISGSVL